MKIITVDDVMSWKPCKKYSAEYVRELIGEGMTPLEICDLHIDIDHKLWALLRSEIIPKKDWQDLKCKFAEQLFKIIFAPSCYDDEFPVMFPQIKKAVEIKRKYLNGEATKKELANATRAVKRIAQKTEFFDERANARTAVWTCSMKVDWSGLWSPVCGLDWSETKLRQINILKNYFKKTGDNKQETK